MDSERPDPESPYRFDTHEIEQHLADLRPRVARAVARACRGWMSGHVEDIVQDVLARLLISLRRAEGKRSFSSIYVEKAAYGAMVDELRRQSRRREEPPPGEHSMETAPSPEAGPHRAASGREIGRGIRDCLLGLERPRRLAMTLSLQGCAVPEAARRLRWPAKRAEDLVYRGLADAAAWRLAREWEGRAAAVHTLGGPRAWRRPAVRARMR